MKKLMLAGLVSVAVIGCSSAPKDAYTKRAELERERNKEAMEMTIKQAPKWMDELPASASAIFANASEDSANYEMSREKAKTRALGKICMSSGGEVNKDTRVYRLDSGRTSTEHSESAVQAVCNRIKVTGVEIAKLDGGERAIKTIALPNGMYRTYVLVVLPLGDANTLRKEQISEGLARDAEKRAEKRFENMQERNKTQN
jgi:hypothetical protein